jgi:predicted RNase H-like HicB family nuclease
MKVKYAAVIIESSNCEFGISFPDFPGCVTVCTWEKILCEAEEALELHIKGMIEDGDDLPETSAIDACALMDATDILDDEFYGIPVVGIILIEVEVPDV